VTFLNVAVAPLFFTLVVRRLDVVLSFSRLLIS